MDILPKKNSQTYMNPVPNPSEKISGFSGEKYSGFKIPSMHNLRLPKLEQSFKETRWPLAASIIILLIVAFAWLALFFYDKSLAKEEAELDSQITVLQEENRKLTLKIKDLYETLKAAKIIIAEHVYTTKVFQELENLSLPNVQFVDFNLSSAGNLGLSGRAQTYNALAKQILIFEKSEYVEGIKVSGISLDQAGGVQFKTEISLDTKIFKKD
jgi:hypothetical protein